MIIFIGAPTHTGKTMLAQRLMERFQTPYLSEDHLKMGLFRGWPDCGFHPEGSDEDISAKLWPVVKAMAMTAIENGQSMIIEGCYHCPEQISEFEAGYAEHVLALWMAFSRRYVEESYEKIGAFASVIEGRGEDSAPPPEEFIREGEALRARCLAQGAQFFEIDGDYEQAMLDIVAWVANELVSCLPNAETLEAMLETECIIRDPNAKRYRTKEEILEALHS